MGTGLLIIILILALVGAIVGIALWVNSKSKSSSNTKTSNEAQLENKIASISCIAAKRLNIISIAWIIFMSICAIILFIVSLELHSYYYAGYAIGVEFGAIIFSGILSAVAFHWKEVRYYELLKNKKEE